MDRRDFMRSALVGIPLLGFPGTRHSPQPKLSMLASWLDYAREPTSGNALVVADLLREYPPGVPDTEFLEAVDIHCQVLEDRVKQGHAPSALVAFRLTPPVSDGAVAEWVDYIIGQYIRVDPESFLQLLVLHPHLIGKEKMLGNHGLELVDNFEGQRMENLRRIESIESVRRTDLLEVRREVLESLYARTYHCRH